MNLTKELVTHAMLERLKNYGHGYWVTLDAKTTGYGEQRLISFDVQLGQFAQRLNSYCLGRRYRRGETRLAIAGAVEVGSFYDRPHAHLVVMHGDEVVRGFEEIELEIRKQWYEVIGATGYKTGNLVNVQDVGNLKSRIEYALKNFKSNQDQANRLVMH